MPFVCDLCIVSEGRCRLVVAEAPSPCRAKGERYRLAKCSKCGWEQTQIPKWGHCCHFGCSGAVWSRQRHDPQTDPGLPCTCLRCGVRVGKKNSESLCPVSATGVPELDAWQCYLYQTARRWSTRFEDSEAEPSAARSAVLFSKLRWKEHLLLKSGTHMICLDCGKHGARRQGALGANRVKWARSSCRGVARRFPKTATELLKSGEMDTGLAGLQSNRDRRIRLRLRQVGVETAVPQTH